MCDIFFKCFDEILVNLCHSFFVPILWLFLAAIKPDSVKIICLLWDYLLNTISFYSIAIFGFLCMNQIISCKPLRFSRLCKLFQLTISLYHFHSALSIKVPWPAIFIWAFSLSRILDDSIVFCTSPGHVLISSVNRYGITWWNKKSIYPFFCFW